MLPPMTKVLGLTGGIATGKSTVARIFEELGAVVIDADAIVHELQAPGMPALDEIAAAFGEEMIGADGRLDRAALGDLVFRDPEARRRLGGIMHPKVGAEMLRRLQQARAAGRELVLLDIPLLFEGRRAASAGGAAAGTAAARAELYEAVILVHAPRELQVERQIERNGYDRVEAERRVASQLPIDEKRSLADHVIDNSGSLQETRRQVEALWRELTGEEAVSPAAVT